MTAGRSAIKKSLLLFALVAWPYYLNDFYLIPLTGAARMSAGRMELLWTLDVLFFCLIPLTTLYILHRRPATADAIAPVITMLRKAPPASHWLGAVAMAILVNAIITNGLEPWLLTNHNLCRLCGSYPFPPAAPWHLITIVYAALSAGMLEEVIFRGLSLTLLRRHIKNAAAVILLSCTAFALVHWCQGSAKLAATFLVSLYPAYYVSRTGNLWPAILFHIIVDVLAFI